MRKLILQEFMSLDGLVAGPNDSVDFIPASMRGDRSFGDEQVALMGAVDTILLGRTTYEMFVGYWPNVTQGDEQPFADNFNAAQKLVFSRTLDRAPWGRWKEARIVKAAPVEEVAKLKREPGKDILISGSISVAQSLFGAGLIDEYRLVLCPVALGKGRSLFGTGGAPIAMTLLQANSLDRGAVSLRYAALSA